MGWRARVCVGEAVAQFCGAGSRVRIRAHRDLRRPSPSRAGAPAPPTPAVCSLGVNPVGAARVRTGRGRRLGAARCAGACPWRSCASGVQCMAQLAASGRRCGACPWRSCTSGVQCMAQFAAGTLRRPRAVRQKKCRASGRHTRVPGGTGKWVFVVHCSWSWLALAVQLLLRCCGASPRSPPYACAACANANE